MTMVPKRSILSHILPRFSRFLLLSYHLIFLSLTIGYDLAGLLLSYHLILSLLTIGYDLVGLKGQLGLVLAHAGVQGPHPPQLHGLHPRHPGAWT